MRSTIKYFFILFILLNSHAQVNASTYSKSGLSLTKPDEWKFSMDSVLAGERLVSFSTGELSGFGLTIITENSDYFKNLELSVYLNKSLQSIKPHNIANEKFNIIQKNISRPPFTGIKINVEYYFLGDKKEIEIEAYMLALDKAKIIAIFDTEKADLPGVSDEIHGVLNSIKYRAE